MHPLIVMCLVRPMTPPTGEQLDMINDLNLNTVLGSHSINRTTSCYSFRVTQWLDTEITDSDCLKSYSARWTKPKKDIPSSLLALDKAELCNYISKRGRGSMKRITQLFAVGMLLCLLAGCSNQASAPSSSPLSSASPSSEMSPTPALSPSAAVVVFRPWDKPRATQHKSLDRRSQLKNLAASLRRQPPNLLLPRRLKPRPKPPQRRRQNPLPIVTPPHAAAR